MTNTTTTLLVLLPHDPDAAVPCVELGARGRILARHAHLPGRPPLPLPPACRCVVAVPGDAVRLAWMELPVHPPAQAVAAAWLRLEDEVAGDHDQLHLALGPPLDATVALSPRPVAVVERARMQQWLRRCQALGLAPDVLLPDYLLLAAPADGGLATLLHDGRMLVRGSDLAFSAEPALARLIAGARMADGSTGSDPAPAEAVLATGATGALLDLQQGPFARRDPALARRRRRIAWLAAATLLSPVLMAGTQAAWHGLAAYRLEQRAAAIAATVPGGTGAGTGAIQALHQRARRASAPARLARHSLALFDAVEALPGARLDSYEFDATGNLGAGLVLAGEQDLQHLRERLAPSGLDPVPLETQVIDAGVRARISLEPIR